MCLCGGMGRTHERAGIRFSGGQTQRGAVLSNKGGRLPRLLASSLPSGARLTDCYTTVMGKLAILSFIFLRTDQPIRGGTLFRDFRDPSPVEETGFFVCFCAFCSLGVLSFAEGLFLCASAACVCSQPPTNTFLHLTLSAPVFIVGISPLLCVPLERFFSLPYNSLTGGESEPDQDPQRPSWVLGTKL